MPTLQLHRARRSKLVSKELDLLLLAGCSCLMTLLYHPVADALLTLPSNANTLSGVAVQVSKVGTKATIAPFHLTLPPEREDLVEEES
jgi:hypothetical protein